MEAADSTREESYQPDTLTSRLKNGPLPQTDSYRILSGIFQGIKTIHNAGFAHRDIKPDNILFVKGVPKLGDVGLMSSLTAAMTGLAGTLDFLPPEIRTADESGSTEGKPRQKNDLYAFGKVIYCAVTGENPNAWPTIPASLPLTLPLKLFIRLSFQLCHKDPAKRLDSIEKLEKEFPVIERKLLYGETPGDKCRYLMKKIFEEFYGSTVHTFHFIKKYWLILLTLLLCGVGAVCYLRPEPKPPINIEPQHTWLYKNTELGLSMTLPRQWDVVSGEIIQKKLEKKQKKNGIASEQKKKLLALYGNMIRAGVDFIYCDFDKEFADNITIQTAPLPETLMKNLTDGDLRLAIRKMFQGELGFKTEIYEIKRLKIAGKDCIFIDLSHAPEKIRVNNYLFPLGDKCAAIALTAKQKTFALRQKEFSAVLTTLKFY